MNSRMTPKFFFYAAGSFRNLILYFYACATELSFFLPIALWQVSLSSRYYFIFSVNSASYLTNSVFLRPRLMMTGSGSASRRLVSLICEVMLAVEDVAYQGTMLAIGSAACPASAALISVSVKFGSATSPLAIGLLDSVVLMMDSISSC